MPVSRQHKALMHCGCMHGFDLHNFIYLGTCSSQSAADHYNSWTDGMLFWWVMVEYVFAWISLSNACQYHLHHRYGFAGNIAIHLKYIVSVSWCLALYVAIFTAGISRKIRKTLQYLVCSWKQARSQQNFLLRGRGSWKSGPFSQHGLWSVLAIYLMLCTLEDVDLF